MNNTKQVYVGESRNVANRMRQHTSTPEKEPLKELRLIIDEKFNKSAALDLESRLIQLFSGDGKFQVLNRNEGIVDAEYFDRPSYQNIFNKIFNELKQDCLFDNDISEIHNKDLYKLSPFKAPTFDQANVGAAILRQILDDFAPAAVPIPFVVSGGAGTGKTVLAIYLLKLLKDLQELDPEEEHDLDNDSIFSEFRTHQNKAILQKARMALVIPQQSLRESVKKVFRSTSGLDRDMVLSPFELGTTKEKLDIIVVDESHRLNQRANQPSAAQNTKFAEINMELFGCDDPDLSQLDWIRDRARHTIFLLDEAQAVRPADLAADQVAELVEISQRQGRLFELTTQMRVQSVSDYLGYVHSLLRGTQEESDSGLQEYEFLLFKDFPTMFQTIKDRDREFGLARLVAGYAWEWKSKKHPDQPDIEIDGLRLQWNRTTKDWVSSANAVNEVGSIHTVQGYDLNYAGVIIGDDLRLDPETGNVYFDRSNYFDAKGKENNPKRGKIYSDDDILTYIQNIYAVLMSRGIRGTFLYVTDTHLRSYLEKVVPVYPETRVPTPKQARNYDLVHGPGYKLPHSHFTQTHELQS